MLRPIFPVPSVHTGDNVSIYLSRHFPVYERDEVQVLPRYYALSVTLDLSVVDGKKRDIIRIINEFCEIRISPVTRSSYRT